MKKNCIEILFFSGVVESPECPNDIQSRESSISKFFINKKLLSIYSSLRSNTNMTETTICRLIVKTHKKSNFIKARKRNKLVHSTRLCKT